MTIRSYLETAGYFQIEKYSSHSDYSKECVAFSGAPRKHPHDLDKLILISDPFSSNTIFFEFKIEDIKHMEELPNIVSETGESLNMVKIWVVKGSLGLKYEPFVVEDTLRYLRDTEVLLQDEPDEPDGAQNN